MAEADIYKEMAERTDGNIYIGVVGPVRTGKSTFIRRFMDLMVLPGLEESWSKERLIDELPQSGGGRTIMTTQISFVPSEAVEVNLSDNARCSVRMVDCVGYMVEGAYGDTENGQPRMVRTPWSESDMPFADAAEMGTRKVIEDHSTIGLVVTTDGTITDLPRAAYVPAEERVVGELKALGKPFVVLLNSRAPMSDQSKGLSAQLSARYGVPVVAMDALRMGREDVQDIVKTVLYEFPVRQVDFTFPTWMGSLPWGHWFLDFVVDLVKETGKAIFKVKDYESLVDAFEGAENIEALSITEIDAGGGVVEAAIVPDESLYYRLLSEESGLEIKDEASLMSIIYDLAHAKREYDRMADALANVEETGYGHVRPGVKDIRLEKPEIVRQGGHYGVRFKATAPSCHMIRVDLSTEVSQMIGFEKQAEDFLRKLTAEYEQDPEQLWKTDFFGTTLYDMICEGLEHKTGNLPPMAQARMRSALSRMVNDGKNNLICILF
jgi:stage IV sporulation protein A